LKFLGVHGVFAYAGPSGDSRYRLRSCCLPRITKTSASGLHLFEARSPTPPILCLRFAVSLAVTTQDSRPSGSLLLSRKALSSSTSCRFTPAHCKRLNTSTILQYKMPCAHWKKENGFYEVCDAQCSFSRRGSLVSPF